MRYCFYHQNFHATLDTHKPHKRNHNNSNAAAAHNNKRKPLPLTNAQTECWQTTHSLIHSHKESNEEESKLIRWRRRRTNNISQCPLPCSLHNSLSLSLSLSLPSSVVVPCEKTYFPLSTVTPRFQFDVSLFLFFLALTQLLQYWLILSSSSYVSQSNTRRYQWSILESSRFISEIIM